MRWILLLCLLAVGCSTTDSTEKVLLSPYPGAKVLQRADLADGFAVVFTQQLEGQRIVGTASLRAGDGDQQHEDHVARPVERMQGLDTPLIRKTYGEAGARLIVAGVANNPGAARVEVSINGGVAITAPVRNGGYVVVTDIDEVASVRIALFDKDGHLLDKWPLTGVQAA